MRFLREPLKDSRSVASLNEPTGKQSNLLPLLHPPVYIALVKKRHEKPKKKLFLRTDVLSSQDRSHHRTGHKLIFKLRNHLSKRGQG
jgi:hypothetical protein